MIESVEQGLEIRRTHELGAAPERVWLALTDPAELTKWFPDRMDDLEIRVGVDGWWFWEGCGRYAVRFEVIEPPRRLVWRWARDPETPIDEGLTTAVEWILEPREDGGTTLRLRESGFAGREHLESNTEGWESELAELEALLAA